MTIWYGYLADLVVAVHLAFMAYIILGQLVIWIGAALGWSWVRNPWFRLLHLGAIVIVAVEAIFGVRCPLTVWENTLRGWAGQEVDGATFVGRLLHNILFHPLPSWIYTTCYISFALLVLGTLFVIPPRLRRARPESEPAGDRIPLLSGH
ncbi:MAG: DUF2784 domain-containing protein [Planctomycetes bacterium]|nr:DUF2784 domain-containing protein [Planctomycetota bacterium]